MPSEPPLHLRLLGTLEAECRFESGERKLSKGKPAALLAYLSLAPGRRASRERLASLLWSDGSSEAARQNLRQTLWYLKRRLGEVILADDDSVGLPAGTTSDVEAFLAASSNERYAEALVAYRGDFIPDFAAPGAAAFEEWSDLERRRLRAILVGCAEAAARVMLGGGHPAEALKIARRARELAPADAATWRLLLECLIAGRDALGLSASLAPLEGEIERGDIDPDPAIRALMRTARKAAGTGDSELDSAEPGPQTLVPDLIGREAEFRTLVDAWEGARRGRGRALMLTGAAGLGKTRLLTDFAARVSSTRGRTVIVRAHQGNRAIAGSLAAHIAEALAALPGAAAISPGSASVLVALSPLLASAFPGAAPDQATGEDAIRRRASAIGDLLGVLCETAALALLLDDSHWADAESMRIVGALRARVEGTRALLVVASRIPDVLRQHIGSTEEIALEPLDVAGVAEFVGRLANLPTEPWSHGLVPRLHEASHGIPLLLIETLQGLVERGALQRRNGQWIAESADALQSAMPPGGALRARLASLDAVERTALVRLATLARPLEAAELEPDEQVTDWHGVLAVLEKRSFVTRSEDRVTVWHDEIGRGVLDLASPDERLAAHGWSSGFLTTRARTLREHALATQHASLSADERRFRTAWVTAVRFARVSLERRSLALVARELLGPDASEEQVQRAIRSTPWELRFGTRVREATLVAFLLVVMVGGMAWVNRPPAPVVTIHARYEADTTRVAVFELPAPSTWQGDAPFIGRLVRRDRSPVTLDGNTRGLRALPRREGWVGVRTYPDSGGDEWVRVRRNGVVERLSTVVGDDGFIFPLPDGSGFSASTRRYGPVFHQSEIVMLDTAGRVLRRVASSEEEEGGPLSSPDGTRVAFVRSFTTEILPSRLCIVHFDGNEESCMPADSTIAKPEVLGWSDARTVLIQDAHDQELFGVDVSEGRVSRIGASSCSYAAWNASGVLFANCIDPQSKEDWAGIATVHAPLAVHPFVVDGQRFSPAGDMGTLDIAVDDRAYLDRVTLTLADSVLSLGAEGFARLIGADANGAAMEVRAVRYTSRDTSVVRVRRDGTLEARRTGFTWIVGTAGGWRTDSARVMVRAFTPRTVLREDWTGGTDGQWRTFGDPAPSVGRIAGAPAFLPNGDGTWESGAITRDSWPGSRGVGLDASVWLPISLPKFQRLTLDIAGAPTESDIERWQRVRPFGNVKIQTLCAVSFPGDEGAQAADIIYVYAGSMKNAFTHRLPNRATFYSARWHRVRLQLMPDGRCALWLDEQYIGSTPEARALPAQARVLIIGASVRTTIGVRDVEVWEGVRR
ncbi:MAG: AAA family ATPase [Gemmatimonadaceae bacterium]|nr:AAA family ATPase [Gemmatimonadaceae bacterium]